MSSLQIDPSGNFHICFRFQGRRFKRSLKTKSEKKANASLAKLDERIWMINDGHLEIPESSNLAEFLIYGAKPPRFRNLWQLSVPKPRQRRS